ncbi:hypothetical protein HAX54_042925 [Datura stramonium]|uniref:MBD domain-containing protein n=1 Tax=Datura stramonium TaxID=4076 RepID=A0ABS8SMS4_DATST|nr:hypothetical protein [Datura stramonium]
MEELKIPFEIEQESTQHSNKKDEVNEKNKRKRRKSNNVVDDSWLPAGWKKIERYRKNGKLAGHIDKSYKAPVVLLRVCERIPMVAKKSGTLPSYSWLEHHVLEEISVWDASGTSLIRNHHHPILDLSSLEMIEAVEVYLVAYIRLRVEKEMRGVKKIRRGMGEGGDVCDECSAG